MTVLAFHIGPLQFDQPHWLWLVPVLWLIAVWLARSTLTGLGTNVRRVALGVRLLVILLLAMALAHPSWRREAKHVAVITIVDQSKSVPLPVQARTEEYLRRSIVTAHKGDELARIVVAREPYVQALPGPPIDRPDMQQIIDRDGTNLAEAIRLALAIAPRDRATRLLLASDGLETAGSLLAAAETAKAAGIPIDILPLRFRHEQEVIVERIVAPATARMGENITLRILIHATAPATGDLSILVNGEPLDLDPDSPSFKQYVELDAGMNPLAIPVPVVHSGAHEFRAVFEPRPRPDGRIPDAIPENNLASTVTFVSGEGRVLVLAEKQEDAAPLVSALTAARIETEVRPPADAFHTLVELGVYDAVLLVNTPAYGFTQQQQELLRSYVHDLGGGLVKVGGPEAFGAGGWIGSPVADALPVKLDPPQKRQMPRGALALIMHSCEMPQGNFWGQQVALAALRNLSARDLIGIVEHSWQGGGEIWAHRLSEVGDGSAARRAINNLSFGDAPSFESMMRMAITALETAEAGQKHCIIISDGDPSPPTQATLKRFRDAQVTVSTVLVFPHGQGMGMPDWQRMEGIADYTGGTFYPVTQMNQLASLPEIFIKEAQTVRRSLIWEGPAFSPALSGLADAMRRIPTPVPQIRGYVVTAEREGLTQVSLRGQENDPILASWQYGLGKSVAFTSDATTRWAPEWVGWPAFRQFWEQHVRWAMRPGGSADIRVLTQDQGERTRIIVEALDPDGERLNFLRFRGRVVGPGNDAENVDLRQVGPGRYEGFIDSARAGAYVMNFRYDAPPDEEGNVREGTVQAAVTRPFADEFRALEDNVALLRQVATLTGGRMLNWNPEADELWSRAGLSMPVALRPIWMWVSIFAIGIFLLDVAVRRVRIDVAAMAMAVRKGLERRRVRAGEQMASLREARERAQQAMAERSRAGQAGRAGGPGAPAVNGDSKPREPVPMASRGVKFEASAEEAAAAARGAGPAGAADLTGGGATARGDQSGKKPDGAAQAKPDENISRLLKAKKRARDEMEQ